MARTKRSGKTTGHGRIAGLASGLAVRVIARPVTSGGTALMAVTATAIMVNALMLQPGRHPAPLFRDTRPVSAEEMVLEQPPLEAGEPDSIDDLMALTTGRPRSVVDPGLVSDIQNELKERGLYAGTVDGLTGPMTSAAIIRFETEAGLAVTGAPTPDVLAALRAGTAPGSGPRSEVVPPDAAAPTVAEDPVAMAAIPAPRAPRPTPPPEMTTAAPDRAASDTTEAITAEAVTTETVQVAADSIATPRAEPAVAVRPAASPPQPRPDVRLAEVQRALDLYGYGPLSADGFWTPETRAAVRRFEENRGLPTTGELTPAFLSELVRIGGFQLD